MSTYSRASVRLLQKTVGWQGYPPPIYRAGQPCEAEAEAVAEAVAEAEAEAVAGGA